MAITRIKGSLIENGSIEADDLEASLAALVSTGGGPKISNVSIANSAYSVLDDTAIALEGGYLVITGTGFASGCQVVIDSNNATSVTFVNSTTIRTQVGAAAAGTKTIYVVNTDGGTAIRVNGLTYSATPSWVTGSTLTQGAVDTAISIQLDASLATSYQLQAGSSLPAGLSLAANGLLTGTVTGIEDETTYNFIVEAIDAENQDSPRSFSINITTTHKISRSLRFNSNDSAYLSRTPASAGNRKTWTWSAWVKRSKLGSAQVLFGTFGGTDANTLQFGFDVNDKFELGLQSFYALISTPVYRDPSGFYHVQVTLDTIQATASNRLRVYINGSEVTAWSTNVRSSITQNSDLGINIASQLHQLGTLISNSWYLNGYMTEVNFVDGQALTPSSFGQTNADTGVWSPINYAGSYGTNGFYLNFSDNSGVTSTTLGKDQAGSNNWTPNNFSVTAGAGNDCLVDTPTQYGTDTGAGGEVRGNYATLNPLAVSPSNLPTITNGNLDISVSGALATITMPIGTWYWEATCTSADADQAVGAYSTSETGKTSISGGANPTHGFIYQANGNARKNGTVIATFATFTNGAVISFAYDASTFELEVYKNNVLQGTITLSTPPSGDSYVPMACCLGGSFTFNFGQRAFAYTAPSGFKALCTQNLPEPTVVQGDVYFNTKLWTGTGASQSVTGVGFQPDWVWAKDRNNVVLHVLQDAVRGANKLLYSSITSEEITASPGFSFNADGFTVGTAITELNVSGRPYVAWNWNAGGSTVTNTAGSIQSQVRASPTAGFSIVAFTDTGSPCTVGHGLGVAPAMIIAKFRGISGNWSIYHQSLGNTYRLRFTTESQLGPSADWWNNTSPTSTVFSLGSSLVSNTTQVAYCFAEVEGYSKFGSYTGNGSADGPFVYTGFRPAFVMLKRSNDVANWLVYDSVRNTFNLTNQILYPNAADAEALGTNSIIDILSNGIKIKDTGVGELNISGGVYIFAAFAETPFKYSLAR